MNKIPPRGLYSQGSPENADSSPAMALIRAQARTRLEQNSDGPPSLEVSFVDAPGDQSDAPDFDCANWKLVETDSKRATWGDKEWLRLDGETLEKFKERVWDEAPIGGAFPKLIVFWGDGDATNAQPQA